MLPPLHAGFRDRREPSETRLGANPSLDHADRPRAQGGDGIDSEPRGKCNGRKGAYGSALRAGVRAHGQEEHLKIKLSPLTGFPGEAGDEAMHAAGHRADEARDFGPFAFEPQLREALPLELMAEERADARAREPNAALLPWLCVEHEDIGQKIAQMGGIDIGADRRGPFPSQPVPMRKKQPRRCQSHFVPPFRWPVSFTFR